MAVRLVILGGGTAGWMAANLFARRWSPEQVQVTLIESPDIGIIGVGEGSTPTLKRFFELIDVPDAQWMPRCEATYKVNIRFDGWSPQSGIGSYAHPFVSQVDTHVQRAFLTNCMTRRLGLNVHTQPDDFFLNGVLAQQSKGPLTPEHFPFVVEYGYHFNSGLLGQFLAELAVDRGVRHVQTRIVDSARHDNGDIAALIDEDGARYDGDVFIDCTGFASVLMQKTLGVAHRSFADNLFNDSAVVMPTARDDALVPETVSIAMSAGWRWRIPLTSRYGNGYVYSSAFIDHDAAETELRTALGMLEDDEPARRLRMNVGQLETHWTRNCVGLGLAQGFIEPLEATALLLVQVTVELFMQHFEDGEFTNREANAFNTKVSDRFERVRDYVVAHYKLNTRNDSDYWRANRDNAVLSDSLKHLFDTWFRCKDLSAEIQRQNLESHFGTLSWHCLLAGYGAGGPRGARAPGTCSHMMHRPRFGLPECFKPGSKLINRRDATSCTVSCGHRDR